MSKKIIFRGLAEKGLKHRFPFCLRMPLCLVSLSAQQPVISGDLITFFQVDGDLWFRLCARKGVRMI